MKKIKKILICLLTFSMTCTGYSMQNNHNLIEDVSADEASAIEITSAGQAISSGEYKINGRTLNANAGVSGLKINAGAIVTLYINGNVTIRGGNANGSTGAGAGIEVPANSTLKIKGSGTLNVYGGNSVTSLPGSNGGNGSASKGSRSPGNGGAGGAGSGGAGAGIGGRGGNGGAGGVETNGGEAASGAAGSAGSSGTTSGMIMLLGSVNVNASGGSAGTPYSTSATGGYGDSWDGTARDCQRAGGGGGGGAGGAGYSAPGIGGGGAGGGGGGAGGKGHGDSAYYSSEADAGGGGGGGGGIGANGYGATGIGGDGNNGAKGNPGVNNSGGTGGSGNHDRGPAGTGGNGASGGYGGSTNDLYKSTYNTYSGTFQTGNGASGASNRSSKVAYDVRNLSYVFDACTFDGTEKKPSVSVAYNGTTIIDGFTKEYSNNIDATTEAIMKITGSENTSASFFVTGDQENKFTISRATFTPSINLAGNPVTYLDSSTASVVGIPINKGTGGDVTWSVTSGTADLTNANSTTLTYVPTTAGSLKLKASITESTNYVAASAETTVTISKADAKNYSIADVANQTFTGKDITPTPVVKYLNKEISSSTDFTYTYTNNKNVGLATITVKGKNNYQGEQSKQFRIVAANINNATVNTIANQTYTGSDIKPEPVVYYNGIKLVKGTDYTVSYSNNKVKGTASLILTGKGNFTGTKTVNFLIVAKEINKSDVKVTAPKDLIFEGKNIESRPTITYNGMTLVEGKDYTLQFKNHLLVGTATVTITGIGNYQSTTTTTYKINKREVTVYADNGQKKTYGTVDPTVYTYHHENDVDGYTATFVGTLTREPGEVVGKYNILQNDLDLSTESQKYYTLKYVTAPFYIEEFRVTDKPTFDGTMGEHDWYVSVVKLVAPDGYTISKSDALNKENWSEYITFADGDYSETGVTYFLKRDSDNAVTVANNITYKQDTKNPTGSIIIGDDAFTSFLNTITFNMFFNQTIEAKVNGADSLSGLQRVEYIESMEPMTYAELDAVSNNYQDEVHWSESYRGTITKDRGIIYAKITDEAGNYIYISTDGLVYDLVNPDLSAEYEHDGVWTKDSNPIISGLTSDELAGLKDRYATYKYLGITQLLVTDNEGNFTIENLPDGDYDLIIESMDKAGNSAPSITFNVKKDTVKPELTLHADTVTISNKQVISFTEITGCSGADHVEIFEDGEWKTVENAFSKGYTATKSDYEYRFRLIDGAGGVSEEVTIVFDNIDTAQPVISLKGIYSDDSEYTENDYTNDKIRVRFQNLSNNKGKAIYEYKLDDGAWTSLVDVNGVCTTPALEDEGHHIYTLRITSQSGVVSEEKTFEIKYDTTPPVVDVDIDLNIVKHLLRSLTFGTYFNDTKELTIAAADPNNQGIASGVYKTEYFVYQSQKDKVIVDAPTVPADIEQLVDGQWIEGTTCTLNPDYSYVVYARVTDKAGNRTYRNTQGLIVDATAPEIDIQYDYNGQWTHDASIEIEAHDNLAGLDKLLVKIDDSDFVEQGLVNNRVTIDGFVDGKHIVIVQAVDKAGNTKLSHEISVKQDNLLPSIQLEGEDDESATSREVKIDVEHTGVSQIEKVEVKLDDGEWEDITDSYKKGHIVKENGTWTYKVSTQAGQSSEATITYNNIFVDELTPVIEAYNKDGSEVQNKGWAQDEVTVKMFNDPTNVKGINYFYSLDDGQWQQIQQTKGVAELQVTGDGEHTVKFKEVSSSDATLVSSIETLQFKIDSVSPELSVKVGTYVWGSKLQVKSLPYDAMFDKDQIFNIESTDQDSGIKNTWYYVDQSQPNQRLDSQYLLASEIESFVDGQWIEGNMGRLAAGKSYVVYAKTIDKAGNLKYATTNGIIIDDISPSISSLHKEEDWITDNGGSLSIQVDESLAGIDEMNDGLLYSINENQPKKPAVFFKGSFDILASELEEGINIITVNAEDKVGNKADEFKVLVKKDTVVPQLTLTQEAKPGYSLPNHLNISCVMGSSGVAKVEILVDGEWIDITKTYQEGYTPVVDGLYEVRLTNGAGKTAIGSTSFSNLDSTQPTVSATLLDEDGEPYESGKWTDKEVTVKYSNLSINDGDVQYLHSLDGENFMKDTPNSEGICEFIVDEEGANQITLRIINKTGYASQDYIFEVKRDVKGPNVQISQLPGWYQVQQVMILAEDNESGLPSHGAYSFDGGKTWQDKDTMEFNKNTDLEIIVRDSVGNQTTVNHRVEIDNLEPIVEEAMQDKTGWATGKTIRAVIRDNEKTEDSGSSGIATVFLTGRNPYKNGQLKRTSPSLSDYVMILENGNVYKTAAPVTDNIGLVFEDNFWIVVIDNAGNATTYTMIIDKIKREDDDKDNENQNPTPDNPDNDSNNSGNQGGLTPDNSGNQGDSGNQGGATPDNSGNQDNSKPDGSHGGQSKPDNGQGGSSDSKDKIPNESMDKIDEIGENTDLNNKEKINRIEDVLNDLLENGNLTNNERMVILSTLEQLKKAEGLELNLKEVNAIINGEMNSDNALDNLDKVDQLLGTKNAGTQKYIQKNFNESVWEFNIIPVVCACLIAGIIVIRARYKYLKEGGKDNEKKNKIK